MQKTWRMVSIVIGLITLMASPVQAMEQKCSLTLNHDLQVSPTLITVRDGAHELYQIRGSHDLVIAGQHQTLNQQQQKSVAAFAADVRQLVPQVQSLLERTLTTLQNTVKETVGGTFGSDSSVMNYANDALNRLTLMWHEMWSQQGDTTTIKAQNTQQWNNKLTHWFKKTMSGVLSSSLSAAAEQWSSLLADGEQSEPSFAQKLQQLGRDLKARLEPKLKALGQQAQDQCIQFKQLDNVETQMQHHVPQLVSADLVAVKI